ncbi:MAG TPA: acetate--CoA ligase [Candidatus Aquilonibacter sp.]
MTGFIEGLLAGGETYAPPAATFNWFGIPDHDEWVAAALADPLDWWRSQAAAVAWERSPKSTFTGTMDDPHWFPDGRLNVTVSCLDRHAASHPQAIAYEFVGEDGGERTITYAALLARVCQLANALRLDGVVAGDRVCIYMPLSIEGIVAMLACARIGAIHSVVYAGLGATALRDRVDDAGATVMIVGDVTYRRGKAVDLKSIVDDAVARLPQIRRVVVWRREAGLPANDREVDFESYCDVQPLTCDPHVVGAEHPLFILYTSGTTGQPKGVVMPHGGYLVGASTLLRLTTGITPDDVYWCTSDIGWIVGHSLMVYGALANRYRIVLREGSPDYPNTSVVYDVIARKRVTKFYTAPTLARMLMRFGAANADAHDLSSLQAMFCAGEPLNPEAWHFLYDVMGRGNVAVCNQWWQTELAGPSIGYLPTDTIRPDRSGKAFGPLRFSVRASDGSPLPAGQGGLLVLETPAPHMFSGVWGDKARFAQYFEQIPGVYTAGDVAVIDAGGTVSVLGRADDVLNVAGHRLATADVESALVAHAACGEAAAIGVPDEIKGEAIVAFVILRAGYTPSEALARELIAHVRRELGPIAVPSHVEIVAKLPKTRSGKIMRRVLRAQHLGIDLGDLTTLDE